MRQPHFASAYNLQQRPLPLSGPPSIAILKFLGPSVVAWSTNRPNTGMITMINGILAAADLEHVCDLDF